MIKRTVSNPLLGGQCCDVKKVKGVWRCGILCSAVLCESYGLELMIIGQGARLNDKDMSRAAFLKLFQVGTTFISQNVLRTTLLLGLSNSLGLP